MSTTPQTPSILLVSGIFFPDVGGPATHVRKIAEHLARHGWAVTIVAFGDHDGSDPYPVIRISRRQPKLLAWLRYGYVVLQAAWHSDVIYAFDLTTAGLPAAIAATIFRKPFALRIGGDPIWERVVEKKARFLPMRAYYEQKFFRADRPVLSRIITWIVRSADRVVTYCDFLKEIYVAHYGVRPEAFTIIPNPLPAKTSASLEEQSFTFIFAGRFVSYKNLDRVIRVFERVRASRPSVRLRLVGDGPEEEALKRMAAKAGDSIVFSPKVDSATLAGYVAGASVALAPALTEFNPNFILESLASGKPALISRDNGLSVQLPDDMQFDPLDDASLEEAMLRMSDPVSYRAALAYVANLPIQHTWEDVLEGHERLLRGLLNASRGV